MDLKNLEVFGVEYTDVAGFKATDDNGDIIVYIRPVYGDNLKYGLEDDSLGVVGVGRISSAEVYSSTSSIADVGDVDYMVIE